MKANRKQTAVKLTATKIGTHVMVRVVIKYGKKSTYPMSVLSGLSEKYHGMVWKYHVFTILLVLGNTWIYLNNY